MGMVGRSGAAGAPHIHAPAARDAAWCLLLRSQVGACCCRSHAWLPCRHVQCRPSSPPLPCKATACCPSHLSRPFDASPTSTEQLSRQTKLRMPAPKSASLPGPSLQPGRSPQAPARVLTLPPLSTSRMQALWESATTSMPLPPGSAHAAVGRLKRASWPGPSR